MRSTSPSLTYPPGSSTSVTVPSASTTSMFMRVSAAVFTTATGMPSETSPRSQSAPVEPPRKPTHITLSPSAAAAIATCAAFPPGRGHTDEARLTEPAISLANRSRRSIAGLALTQMIIWSPFWCARLPRGQRPSAAQEPERVVAVDAAQHLVGQAEAVNLPAPLPRRVRGVVEILVRRFEKAEVEPVHLLLGDEVRAEEDAVAVVDEELARRVGQIGRAH